MTRRIIQIIFFFLMPGSFVAGFTGVRNIAEQIGSGMPITVNSFLITLSALLIFTVVFGRFFCGFVCAFGSLGDFIYFLSGLIQKKLFRRKKQIQIPEKCSVVFTKIKYFILILVIAACAFGFYGSVSAADPWTVFSFITALRLNFEGFEIGFVCLILILVAMAFKERFFCRYLCPMGAVFSVLPVLPFAYLKRDPDSCLKRCSACQRRCPVGIKLESDGIKNGECIACERCASVCPKKNLTRWDRKTVRLSVFSMILRAGIFFVMGWFLGLCRL